MKAIIKTTIKLLLRNKGFIFFMLAAPIVSTLILASKFDYDVYLDKAPGQIIELKSKDDKAVYNGENYSFIVKVYDGSGSQLSEYLLKELAQNDMFSVCRADVTKKSSEEVRECAEKDAYEDRAGILLYLKKDFDSAVMNDSLADGIELFGVSDDSRQELFTAELSDVLSKIYRAGTVSGGDITAALETLDNISEQMPHKKVTDLAGKNEIVLDRRQSNNKVQIGYAFAFITLGFVFCGVFAAHTVITEDHNKVFTRIMLSGFSTIKYFTAKSIVVVLMCILETMVLGISLLFVRGLDLGIPLPLFLITVFLLGLIFATFSMLTGIIFGDIMSSNYAAFTIWSISAMLSGLLFPIDDTSAMLKTLSYLMPQRWFFDASEKLLAGMKGAFAAIPSVTAAYLIVIICIGSVGLKIRKQET